MPAKAAFLCISANPAIDKRVRAKSFRAGAVNRVEDVTAEPGGKAAHVALSLCALGERPSWLGFTGGPNGHELLEGLNDAGIDARGVTTRTQTRVNLAILDGSNGVMTEILEPGGPISPSEVDAFLVACEQCFSSMKEQSCVIFSGSLPPGVPDNFYATLIHSARSAGCRTFLDASGAGLKFALCENPDFVKPNLEEAETILGTAIADVSEARAAVSQFFGLGARSVALSLGKNGLLWAPGPKSAVTHVVPPVVDGRSCVGSGDATVAGFAYGIAAALGAAEAAVLASACGAANCLADSPGRIRASRVDELKMRIRFETLC